MAAHELAAAAAIVAILALLPAGSADWQVRSNVGLDPGPASPDVTLRIDLNMSLGFPVAIGSVGYFLEFQDALGGNRSILALDPTSESSLQIVAEVPGDAGNLAWDGLVTDGERLVVILQKQIRAYHLDGSIAWTTPYPQFAPDGPVAPDLVVTCQPAIDAHMLYVFCQEGGGGTGPLLVGTSLVAAVDTEDGRIVWTWQPGAIQGDTALQGLPVSSCNFPPPSPCTLSSPLAYAPPLIGGGHLYVATMAQSDSGSQPDPTPVNGAITNVRIWALDGETGRLEWRRHLDQAFAPNLAYWDGAVYVTTTSYDYVGPRLRAFDAQTGADIWAERLLPGAHQFGGSLAANDGILATVGGPALQGIHLPGGEPAWPGYAFPDGSWSHAPILAGGRIYLVTFPALPDSPLPRLHAFDAATGSLEWALELEGGCGQRAWYTLYPAMAVSQGILFLACTLDGEWATRLWIVGRTTLSLAPAAEPGFPVKAEPAGEVAFDLSRTQAGIGGPASRFRAVWGDGNVTGWEASSRMEHRYDAVGTYRVRLEVANDAGQVSTLQGTVQVRRSIERVDGTFYLVERAFAAEHREATFFVLGLLVSGLGGAWAAWRARRGRRRLRKELRAVEEIFGLTRHNPSECLQAMAERRQRARQMLADGAIDTGQHNAIAEHTRELEKGLRREQVDQRLAVLPASVARDLEAMLRDGVVTRLETRHFLEALGRDRSLSPDYKARLRGLVGKWAAEDTTRLA